MKNNPYIASNKTIVVALSLNEESDHLLKIAESFCKRTGLGMTLVNVVEPWVGAVGLGLVPFPDVSGKVQKELASHAEEQLLKFKKKIDPSIEVFVRASTGPIAETIISEAKIIQAPLILTGSKAQKQKILPSGFSTAISLMSHSPIPVMVSPATLNVNFEPDGINILLADNLSEDDNLIGNAFDFADVLGANVHHVYANPVNGDELEGALKRTSEAKHLAYVPELTGDDILEKMNEKIHEQLKGRASDRIDHLVKKQGKYETVVLNGEPSKVITKYMNEEANQFKVTIFGRHKAIHLRPFFVGQVPFHSMLASQHLILMSPDK